MDMSPKNSFYFVAVSPGKALASQVQDLKEIVLSTVGEQLYLSDPPHLTLYLSNFQDQSELWNAFSEIRHEMDKTLPGLEILGWKVFDADVLTGNHTLVLQLGESTQTALRNIQALVIEKLSKLRHEELSQARYQAAWDRLAPNRQESVLKYGYPFTGNDWQPHITIASISPKVWSRAWHALKTREILGTFHDCHLTLYHLDEYNRPREMFVSSKC
jgi:2'-5' RNA ligase